MKSKLVEKFSFIKDGCSYVAGQWLPGRGKELVSRCPFDQQEVWVGRACSERQVQDAVSHARDAQTKWAGASFLQRKAILHRFTQIVRRRSEELACLISWEIGKPLWESRQEVAATVAKWSWTIKAHRRRCHTETLIHSGLKRQLFFKPYGVVVVIGPFNFPAHIPNGQIMPSLLMGNTVIFKPSEYAPAVAQWMMRAWLGAGLPKGVLQLVQGDGETARHLLAQDIDVVFFTGSYATGRAIQQQLSDRPHIVFAMEAGGNNPMIVSPSGQTQKAFEIIERSCLITAGQRCTCARRLIVVESAKTSAWLKALWRRLDDLRMGGPFDEPQPFYGPVVSTTAGLRLKRMWTRLLRRQAVALRDLKPLNKELTLFRPAVCDMTRSQTVFDEEIFGPVIILHRVKTFDEALILANRTRYGLAAGLISLHKSQWETFQRRVRAGVMSLNAPTTGAFSGFPFLGVGYSGNGRPVGLWTIDHSRHPVACTIQDEF